MSWVVLLLAGTAYGDLPVHCMYTQILGEWRFTLNTETFTASLHDYKTTCGHGQPDRVLNIDPRDEFEFEHSREITVTLSEPNKAHSPDYGHGTWSMIYDEGFMLNFNGIVFFTYSLYVKEKNARNYDSVCDRTTIGWYRGSDPKDHTGWGCFFGEKTELALDTERTSVDPNAGVKWVQPSFISFLQKPVMYEDYTTMVDSINSSQSSWQAGISTHFQGLTLTQVNQKLGKTQMKTASKARASKILPSLFLQTQTYMTYDQRLSLQETDHDSLIAFWNTPIESISSESLPLEWDWTNIDGVDYVTSVREQGNCGGCYVISTIGMLESRLRILTNNEFHDKLSAQYLVSCNFYTEGCNGGYPTLVNKFISEFGVVPESCMQWEAEDGNCSNVCDESSLPYRISVSDFYYIGGYYGASDEETMMKELRARGPIIGNFEPQMDFSYYMEGVYSKVPMRSESPDISDTNMRESHLEMEKVDHSVLIVGWGEDNGEKYWKLMNSWGPEWGENGFFRMRRGTDESSIESMGEAAVPYIVYN